MSLSLYEGCHRCGCSDSILHRERVGDYQLGGYYEPRLLCARCAAEYEVAPCCNECMQPLQKCLADNTCSRCKECKELLEDCHCFCDDCGRHAEQCECRNAGPSIRVRALVVAYVCDGDARLVNGNSMFGRYTVGELVRWHEETATAG